MEERLEIKTSFDNFKDLEYYLFSLVYPKSLRISVSFFDNPSVYNYHTDFVNEVRVLVTD